MVNGGIFGPKLSGKSTLAMHLSQAYWRKEQLRSLVLDPNKDDWGEQAYVTDDEEKFWVNVWKTKGSLIIVDEAASTIRREKTLIPVFTRLRHLNHKLIVIGHSGMSLLPVMREQLDTLYLFRQCKKAADIWADTFTDESLLAATQLRQYEFIHARLYHGSQKSILDLKPKTAAVVPVAPAAKAE